MFLSLFACKCVCIVFVCVCVWLYFVLMSWRVI